MDIKRAKEEIIRTVRAYLDKDESGEYRIPSVRQRPVLLMGPPGIGKTQIMEQIAGELSVGLVSYTMTHHTRQSAVGLPFIQEKEYGGRTYSVTEYTMSEIIASVYEKMEKTGLSEGILFLDEINCVSETLAPMMLQFLQGKTFGNHRLPGGWVVVAAGNPPEYNKSVREFDVVTLDRMKRIDVTADFAVWQSYAYRRKIHPAILSYLELKRDSFYRIETTVDGKQFVTARGWEDLSELMDVYDRMGYAVDRDVVGQYLQHPAVAKDFANYVELYEKYRKDYQIPDILEGVYPSSVKRKLQGAAFDERFGLISLLHARLSDLFAACRREDDYVTMLYERLLAVRDGGDRDDFPGGLSAQADEIQKQMDVQRQREQLTVASRKLYVRVQDRLRQMADRLQEAALDAEAQEKGADGFDQVRALFAEDTVRREEMLEGTGENLAHVFHFLEDVFGQGQEMVAFMTKLNADEDSLWFVKENGSPEYFMHNKGLLFDERQQDILRDMASVTELLEGGISGDEPSVKGSGR